MIDHSLAGKHRGHAGCGLPGYRRPAILGLVAAVALAPGGLTAQHGPDPLRERIRARVEAAGLPAALSVEGVSIRARSALPQFYESRAYLPAWTRGGEPIPLVNGLLRAIGDAEREGLTPADYHQPAIESVLDRIRRQPLERRDPSDLVDLDLLLTDAFLSYGTHLLAGHVDPVTLTPDWIANPRERNIRALLDTALQTNRVESTLESLLPDHEGYFRLREARARYRSIARQGGWPSVGAGPKLEAGSTGDRVVELRARLAASGDLSPDVEAARSDSLDTGLERAVRRFQTRHGLDSDGVVGAATLAALNISAEDRARQIELNMERWRWLPEHLGDRYIIVNIAGFELDVVESGSTVLSMRVVVGRPYRRTPVFTDTMTYLVFNPYWYVPRNLAVQDILPQIRKDPGYLARQRMQVFSPNGDREVNPEGVDWTQVSAQSFRYALRQQPGPQNALGRVKFMFPNRFNVYLHDTPARDLFAQTARGFSSGCIRLEHPLELAQYLLREDPGWTRARIDRTIEQGTQVTVRLPRRLPIHLLYWTAWAEADGSIHFRPDVYDRDSPLRRALGTPPPSE